MYLALGNYKYLALGNYKYLALGHCHIHGPGAGSPDHPGAHLWLNILSAPHIHDEQAAYDFVGTRIWPKGRACP